LQDVISAQSLPLVLANFMTRNDGGMVPVYEIEARKKNGETINFEANAVLISTNGKFVGDLVILRDITASKKAEYDIKSQKELVERVLSTTPSSVIIVGKDSRLIMANSAFYKVFDRAVDVAGIPIEQVINVGELLGAVANILDEKESNLKIEFRYPIHGNARTFVADILDMKQNEVLVILTDVTEERERQDRWLLTDRMASIGEMASGVAHELNNPLTGVIALSQLLAEEEVPPDIREDLNCICSEAKRAASVVKNLLTFARKHSPEKRLTQLNNVIQDVLKLRAYEQKINGIRTRTVLQTDLPEVRVDYFQLQQVLLNIILNAEQAMLDAHQEGTLTITSRNAGDHVELSFEDNGPGITRENLNKLFSPFFTTKEVGKGTGLGLSICYGIISNHEGKIYARSEPGKGATFIIELPLEKQSPEETIDPDFLLPEKARTAQ
jgi:signal transduction histidine kinase